jgi:S1-C subfamily serine protease
MTRKALAAAIFLLASGAGTARAGDDIANLEAKLAAAQERLEQAANEIAALSSQLGEPMMRRMILRGPAAPPPLIGVALDPDSGRDGARVLDVSPGGPAAAAGLREGDVIVSVNGESLGGREHTARETTRALRAVPPGQPLQLEVRRAGKPLALSVKPRITQFDGAELPIPPMPSRLPGPVAEPSHGDFLVFGGPRAGLAGLEFVTLTPALGEYFGVDKGVLVLRAPKDGALQLREGDVIQSIGGREPGSGAHATRILASYQPGESVPIKVLRKKTAVTLNVKFPG